MRTDAGYFIELILIYILALLHVQPMMDINPRRRCKKAVGVVVYILAEWYYARGKSGYPRRFYVLIKRCFGDNHVQVLSIGKV